MMDGRHDDASPSSEPVRQPGWVPLVAVAGIACLMIGLMLVLTIQAPVPRPRAIVIGSLLIVAGFVLLPVAWFGRARGPGG